MTKRVFIVVVLLAVIGFSLQAMADDESCVRMECLGKCFNLEDTEGKAFSMLCLQQSICYRGVECAKLDDGNCGWVQTPELDACLADMADKSIIPNSIPIQ